MNYSVIFLSFIVWFCTPDFASGEINFSRHEIQVPLDHFDDKSRLVTITYAKLWRDRSLNGMPTFVLLGGPGTSGVQQASLIRDRIRLPAYINLALNFGPIYFFDPRDTGDSDLVFKCDITDVQSSFTGGGKRDYVEHVFEVVKHCKRSNKLVFEEIQFVNNVQISYDLISIAQENDIDSLYLYGTSYGSQLAQVFINNNTDIVERAIFNLVEPIENTYKLPSQVDDAIVRLDEVRGQIGYPPLDSVINTFLEDGLVEIKTENNAATLFEKQKFIYHSLDAEQSDRLYKTLLFNGISNLLTWKESLRAVKFLNVSKYAVDCSSGIAPERSALINNETDTRFAGVVNFPMPYICDALGINDYLQTNDLNYKIQVPVLAFSGYLDHKTPYDKLQSTTKRYTLFMHYIVKELGHDTCTTKYCIDIIRRFLTSSPNEMTSFQKIISIYD